MDIEFLFIGWQCDVKANTDKVWAAFKVNNDFYSCWGRRGKTLRFKHFQYGYELKELRLKKEKDYEAVDEFELFSMFPGFEEEVQEQLTFSVLANKVM